MLKVSIVIPIYNVEQYVRECIQSVMNQTLKEIEIICIDDASTDNSLKIAQECAKIDKRISVITYDSNKSASQARKDGTMMAKGEYILYLDGDDYIEPNTCEELYKVITEQKVDILHFGTRIINEGYADERRIQNVEKNLLPLGEKILGDKVFQSCFLEKSFRFTIWNKLYSSKLCKKAFKYVQDGNYPKAQDLYAFFVICYFAESYFGLTTSTYYNYRFGAGITGNDKLNLKQFERHCQSVWVADAIEKFATYQQSPVLEEIVKQVRSDLLNDCIGNWYYYLPDEMSDKGFELLTYYWEDSLLVSNLCSRFFKDRRNIAKKIFGANVLKYNYKRDIKTIGIFYHRFALGGVQRVISHLIPMYLEMGYKIIFFTDEFYEEDEYELPDEVKRIVLPSSLTIKPDEFNQRSIDLEKAILKYQVDIMLYHAASSRMLLFDMILIKLKKIPFIITVHEVAFQGMLTMNIEMVNRPDIYRLADYITVLSKIEEKYWRSLGVRAVYIPNPVEDTLVERVKNEIETNTILWLGRLDFRTKRYMDTIDIMNYVVKAIPEARLLIVGNEIQKGTIEKIENRVKLLHLEENVKLCGHSSNVDQYYRKAGIYLLTSKSESFSMTIVESKSYGIPLVMYELPYLEITKIEKGFVSVPQGDIKSMADAIIRLLRDDEYRERMGKEAQESLIEFNNIDLKVLWEDIFNSIKTDVSIDIKESRDMQVLMNSFLSHYEAGCIMKNQETQALKMELRKVEKEVSKKNQELKKLKKLKKSKDYKLGHIILYIPRIVVRFIRKKIKILK